MITLSLAVHKGISGNLDNTLSNFMAQWYKLHTLENSHISLDMEVPQSALYQLHEQTPYYCRALPWAIQKIQRF